MILPNGAPLGLRNALECRRWCELRGLRLHCVTQRGEHCFRGLNAAVGVMHIDPEDVEPMEHVAADAYGLHAARGIRQPESPALGFQAALEERLAILHVVPGASEFGSSGGQVELRAEVRLQHAAARL